MSTTEKAPRRYIPKKMKEILRRKIFCNAILRIEPTDNGTVLIRYVNAEKDIVAKEYKKIHAVFYDFDPKTGTHISFIWE